METKIYNLKVITNLHVGSGDLSYGIIDKLVQRDVVSLFPTINASGIKGSIKEHLENYPDGSKTVVEYSELLKKIFGSELQPADNKFFSAHLLSYPVRSNIKPFFRATCPAILNQLIESLRLFGIAKSKIKPIKSLLDESVKNFNTNSTSDFIIFQNLIDAIILEDYTEKFYDSEFVYNNTLVKLFGDKNEFVVVRDSVFMEICSDLPVVARNNLDEKSRNLWYEEFVPRQTEFWFFHLYKDFNAINELKRTKTLLQIGANASVGEGYCDIVELFNNNKTARK
ncbi:MAG: type III-B CRISPR module RAMP protein Cmr4 [Bacteroidales bacterium]|nr:type III-B CRISPR module RAMP protein Cmr4 [Bacteroidales bacterium]